MQQHEFTFPILEPVLYTTVTHQDFAATELNKSKRFTDDLSV